METKGGKKFIEGSVWLLGHSKSAYSRSELSELPQSSVIEGWKIKPNFRRSKVVLEKGGT